MGGGGGEGGSRYRGVAYRRGDKNSFSLIRYRFFRSNALYSKRLSLRMFILLTPFDTWDCYNFESNLNQVLLLKVLYIKKACNTVSQSSKNGEITLPHEFIFVFIRYSNGTILSEKSCQKQGVRMAIQRRCPKKGGSTTAQFALVRLTDNKARKSRLILLPVKNYIKNMKLFEIKSHHQVM